MALIPQTKRKVIEMKDQFGNYIGQRNQIQTGTQSLLAGVLGEIVWSNVWQDEIVERTVEVIHVDYPPMNEENEESDD